VNDQLFLLFILFNYMLHMLQLEFKHLRININNFKSIEDEVRQVTKANKTAGCLNDRMEKQLNYK